MFYLDSLQGEKLQVAFRITTTSKFMVQKLVAVSFLSDLVEE